jgi:hypothetical protein
MAQRWSENSERGGDEGAAAGDVVKSSRVWAITFPFAKPHLVRLNESFALMISDL